jgi:TPR repeat protein
MSRLLVVIAVSAIAALAPSARADDHALLVFLPGDVGRGMPRIPSDDLVALADVLPRAGYTRANTTHLSNPTATQLRKALKAIKEREKGGRVLVAIVGHTLRPKGSKEAHIAPADGKAVDIKTLISLKEVYRALEVCKADAKFLLLDVCRPVVGPAEAGEPHALPVPEGVAVLFSCSAGETGHDMAAHPSGSPDAKGAFLHAVCEAFGGKADYNRDGLISLRELQMYVEEKVPRSARLARDEKQVPVLGGWVVGTLPVARVITGPGSLGAVTADTIERLPAIKGAGPQQPRITFVFPGRAANHAGLKAGDVIVSVDGKAVATQADLASALAGKPVGAKVTVEVMRAGKQAVPVYLEEPLSSAGRAELKKAAEAGDAEAMFELRADRAWLEAAVEKRHPMALAALGRAYLHGLRTEKDAKEGARLVRLAAETGLARGQYELAGCYLRGDGVKKNAEEAARWYLKAAGQGLADAERELARLHLAGLGVKKDAGEALRRLRLAAARGDGPALFTLAVMHEQGKVAGKGIAEARALYQKAAEAGHGPAQCRLGQLHHLGKGGPVDFKLAAKWYGLAARQGVAIAQYNLGTLYEAGKGVEKDLHEAHRLYRLVAHAGETTGIVALALLFDAGKGCEQDHVKAAEMFTRAAEKGNALAQYRLGCMFLAGRGVGKDREKALEWLKKASASGHPEAKAKLKDLFVP